MRRTLRLADGSYKVLLRSNAEADEGAVIMDLSAEGEPLAARRVWSTSFPAYSLFDMAPGPSGALFAIRGDTITNGIAQGWLARNLVKLNSTGAVEWARRITYQLPDGPSVSSSDLYFDVDHAGNIFVDGGSYVRPLILKFNAAGTFQWGRAIYDATHGISTIKGLRSDELGGCYFTARRLGDGMPGEQRIVLGRLSAVGDLLFSTQVDPGGSDADSHVTDVQRKANGDLLIAGERYWGSSPSQGLVMSTTADGAVQWIRSYARPVDSMWNYSTVELSDGSLVTHYQAYSQNLLHTDAQGQVLGATEALHYEEGNIDHAHGFRDLMPAGARCALGGWSSHGLCLSTLWLVGPQEFNICGFDTIVITATDLTSGHVVYTNTATITPVTVYSYPATFLSEAITPYGTGPFCSVFLGTEEPASASADAFRIFPNPGAGNALMDGPDLERIDRITWTDITGRTLLNERAVHEGDRLRLRGNHLPPAVYLIQLWSDGVPQGTVRFARE